VVGREDAEVVLATQNEWHGNRELGKGLSDHRLDKSQASGITEPKQAPLVGTSRPRVDSESEDQGLEH
jgi:hypothetical protein